MILSVEWRALQRESQLAAEQIATGVTILGRSNHAQTGFYSQAFFALSIGLERLGKLIIITDHAIKNDGSFPTNEALRRIGHDLRKIIVRCEEIAKTADATRAYATRPVDSVHQGIEETLSEFAARSRYYNLDYITGKLESGTDPITMWWEKVAGPICERHYSERQRRKDAKTAVVMAELFSGHSTVMHHAEDGTEINDIGRYVAHAGATAVVQRYGRFYVLQIVRWLTSILFELSHRGAYERRIEPLLGLHEPFVIFFNEDQFLRNRKSWSIYPPYRAT